MRASLPGLLAALLLSWLPAGAEAAPQWTTCPDAAVVRCTTVDVPLDRSGAVPGTVSLRIARLRLRRADAPVLMYLSGGPGGAGVSEMLAVLGGLPEVISRYTVVGFDQRGTGRSGLIRCPEMQRDGRVRSASAAAACAARLGPRRAFYTTPDSVEDMEAIRAAIGAERVTLFGVSYGTELALAYSRAHPDRVDRMILDSVVDPDDVDPFGLAGFRAMPRTLRLLCPIRCRGVSADPAADLSRLTAALRAAPLRGRVFDARGRGRTRTLDPVGIADLLYDADYAPWMRAAVPAAVRAALEHRDAAPLLRLEAMAAPLAAPERAIDFSAGRYSTVCEETPLPWDPAAAPTDRAASATARAAALGPTAFAPFDAAVAFADEIELCLDWPAPFRPPPAPLGPYPAVPALLLQGGEDLRTPPSASAAVASRMARAQRVVVPGVGHAVLSADPSACGRRRLLAFLRGGRVAARCPRVPTGVPPAEVPPMRFGDLQPLPRMPLRTGRTLRALAVTVRDVAVAASIVVRGGGLRGGSFSIVGGGLILQRVVVVPGVRVTGHIRSTGAADFRIGGSAAAPGRIRLRPGGRLTGRLGGRPFQFPPRGAASAGARARAAATDAPRSAARPRATGLRTGTMPAVASVLRAAAASAVRAAASRRTFARLP
jgi:pimeloyl-ACP methyl ester carboxylesterase